MTTEAAAAGFYKSPNGKKYPRRQLLTVAGLLDGTQRALLPDYEPDLGFKRPKLRQAASKRLAVRFRFHGPAGRSQSGVGFLPEADWGNHSRFTGRTV